MMRLLCFIFFDFLSCGWFINRRYYRRRFLKSLSLFILLFFTLFTQQILCSNLHFPTDNHIHIDTSAFSYNVNDLSDNNTAIVYAKPPKPLNCPPIPNISHANTGIVNSNPKFAPGSKVIYSCDNGYRQTGEPNTIQCLTRSGANGSQSQEATWTNTSMKCQIVDCGDPGYVENAIRTGSVFTYSSMVNYTCNKGYEMKGPPFLLCSANGRWNRDRPRCEIKTCPELPKPANGVIIYTNGLRYNSSASLRCNDKFRVKIQSVLTCSLEKKWIGDLSECEEISCPQYKPHSGVTIRGRKQSKQYKPGDMVVATCHDKTSKTLICGADGTWSIDDFHCPEPLPKLCPIVTPLENGRHNGSSKVTGYPEGTLITFICNPNYYRDGAPYIRCRHGNWTSQKPRCALHEYYSLSRSPSSASSSNQLTVLGTVLFVVLFFILLVLSIILHRLRQRHLEKQYWKRYFGNHTYRQSRTNITATCNQEMRFFCQSRSPVPVTDL